MTPLLKKILAMNWPLVLVMYGLLVFGVFAIESAARHLAVSAEDLRQHGSAGAYYAAQQKTWILIGSVVYFTAAFFNYRLLRWFAIPFYLLSLGLLGAAIAAGDKVHRLEIGPISFQPAQSAIAAGIIMIAWLLQDLPRLHRWFGLPMARLAIIAAAALPPFGMVLAMGDMGSALVWIPVLGVAMLIGGIPFRYLSFLGLIAAGLLPLMFYIALPMASGPGTVRIETWLKMLRNQPVDIKDAAYAAHNVSTAVGKSGWSGAGWNATGPQSLHAKRFIPKDTAHNDYIFAVIGEEFGFRGSLLLLVFFAGLLSLSLFAAYYSRDLFGRLLVCMTVALFFAHIFENIGMCVLLMPITGIPLPLISYSGTFAVICMFLLGLVQSVWIHRRDLSGPVLEEDEDDLLPPPRPNVPGRV